MNKQPLAARLDAIYGGFTDGAVAFGDWFSNSLVGGILSVVTGDPSYERPPGSSVDPVINVFTDNVSVTSSLDQAAQERAAAERATNSAMQADRGEDPMPEAAGDINRHDWSGIAVTPFPSTPHHDPSLYAAQQRAQDEAWSRAMYERAQEQEQSQSVHR